MASATEQDEKHMATDVTAPGADDGPEKYRPPDKAEAPGGFFTIYKKGQGYWTRMGTAACAALIAVLSIGFLYQHIPAWVLPVFDHSPAMADPAAKTAELARATATTRNVTIAVCTAVLLGWSLLVFYLMNKPTNADFLIATDSEMKKVNWTSRKELIGSTKVVIVFMFLIAILLFGFDVIFGYLFYALNVLKSKPF